MTMIGSTLRRTAAAGLIAVPLLLGATGVSADDGQLEVYHGGDDTVRAYVVQALVKAEPTHTEAVALGDDGNGVITFRLVGGARVIAPAIPSQPGTLVESYHGDGGGE